jgi:ADP-heptose:LPS heptosyltransferase
LSGKTFFVLHPKSSTVNKDWKLEEWKRLVDLLLQHGPCLQVGGDKTIHADIISVPTNGMMQFALLPQAAVCICVDSLFLHASAARGVKRCCVLLGSSDPQSVLYPNYTYIYKQIAECQPCGRPYIHLDIRYDDKGCPLKDEFGEYIRWECPDRRCFDWLTSNYVYEEVLRLIKT